MKENNVLKRLLSVFLTVAMIVSLVAVAEPAGLAQAAETVGVYSEDFESGAVLTTHAGSGSQENRLETGTNSYLQLTGLTATQLATPGISVEENTEYILSYRVKAANVSGNFYFYTWGQAWNDSDEYSTLAAVPGAIQTATDGWQTVQGTYTFSKNHVQFFFEEAWGGSADVCLDDITLTNTATGEIAYLESFDTTAALTVRSGMPTQTQVKEELPEYYLQIAGASSHSVKTPEISVEANTEYVLSYRVKVDNVSGSAYFYTWRQEWDDNGNYSGVIATVDGITASTDGWQTVEVNFTAEKNHVQFFFEEAWGGSVDVCLDDITLKAVGSETAAYYEDFTTQQALTVHSAGLGGTQSFVQDGNHYLALLGASGYSVKTDGISLEAGAEYALSYRVKMESVSDSVYFYIWRQEWDDEGNYSGLINTVDGITAATDGWQTVETTFTAGKNHVQFFFEQAWSGSADICLDDIQLTKVADAPVEEESTTMETALAFNRVDAATWFLDAANVSQITGSYYFATVIVDGGEQKVVFEKMDAGFVICEGFFTSVPQSSFEIPEGTVLYQFDPNVSWNDPISGGQWITVTQKLTVAAIGDGWYGYDIGDDQTGEPTYINIDAGGEVPVSATDPYEIKKQEDSGVLTSIPTESGTYDISTIETDIEENAADYTSVSEDAVNPDVALSLKKADDTSWQFHTTGELTADGSGPRYYKMSVMIDGIQTSVLVEVPTGQTYFEIYTDSFFGVYGGKIPESSFEISAGAVLNRVDSSTLQEAAGGDSIHITRDFRVEITKTLVCKRVVLYKTGDANADNTVELADLVAMKRVKQNAGAAASLSGAKAADVNASGSVDAIDILALRSYLLGKSTLAKTKADALLNGVMPIIGYDGPNYDASRAAAGYEADFITQDIYRLVKDVGINTVVANGNEVGGDLDLAKRHLQIAQDNGIKVYLNNAYVSHVDNGAYATDPAVDLNAMTEAYAAYSSFAGYYVYDEPYKEKVPTLFGDTERMVIGDFEEPFAYLRKFANIIGYMNLFPCISTTLMWELDSSITKATITESKYKAYLTAASDAGADFISYDLYLRENGDADYANKKQGFYTNLEWANAVAGAEGKPFYAFIQVGTDFADDNSGATSQSDLTTVQEMYLEANAALAMGARGLNYYSLIQPVGFAKNSGGGYDLYRSGLINLAGNANNGAGGANYEYYNAAKKINTYVAKVDEVLMNAVYQGVISTDSAVQGYLGSDITSYESLASVTGSSSALVGCFDYYGKEAYMVVNTSCDGGGTGSQQTVTLNFRDTVSYTATGMDCETISGSGSAATFTIAAGECVLVVLD